MKFVLENMRLCYNATEQLYRTARIAYPPKIVLEALGKMNSLPETVLSWAASAGFPVSFKL